MVLIGFVLFCLKALHHMEKCHNFDEKIGQHFSISCFKFQVWSLVSSINTIGLLHNHWFLIEEEGLGWGRMAVTLFSQCDRKLLNC